MELILAEEQRLLRDSAQRLVAERVALSAGKRAGAVPPFDRMQWRRVAEAGWLAILAPEGRGGLGLGVTELCLVLEVAGQAPLVEPIGLVAVVAGALAESDNGSAHAELLASVIAGELIAVPGFDDRGASVRSTPCDRDGETVKLTGTIAGVAGVTEADGFLVAAVGSTGVVLAWVGRTVAGLTCTAAPTVDGGSIGGLALDGAEALVVAGSNRAPTILAKAFDRLLLAASAELLGVMERAHALAVDYTKTRQQFDRPIGSFQALQHRAVTDYTEIELTRSLLFQVCALADNERLTPGLTSAVKAKSSSAALGVAKSAIQLHGAIGYTSELSVGRYLKRALALSAQHGNDVWHRERYARLSGLGG